MLFQTILRVALMATLASASPLGASASGTLDLPTVQAAFNKVSAAIDRMIESVNAFDGDVQKLPPILETSLAIAKMNSEGAVLVKQSPTMGITDALAIVPPTLAIQEKVMAIVAALNAKKDALEKAGAKEIVLEQMYGQRKSADELAAAILGNLPLPALIGPIAAPIAATITDALNAGITAWGGTPPPTPSSSGASAPKAPKGGKGKGGKGSTALWIDGELPI